MIWPKVECPGTHPNRFVAFVQLNADSRVVRIKFVEAPRAPRWRCDEHGKSRDVNCEHAMAALPLTTQEGWAEHFRNRKERKPMVNPDAPTEAEIRALLLIYRGLIDNGRDHDSAARLVSQLDGIAYVKDDELDLDRIATTIRAQSPTGYDQSPQATADRYMTAIAMVEGMFRGDTAAMHLVTPAPPETLALFAAQAAVTKMVLDNWLKGQEAEVLRTLRGLILDHTVATEIEGKDDDHR